MDKVGQNKLRLNEEIVLQCAITYGLGRMTYVVGSICDELIRLQDRLSEHFKENVSRQIQEYQTKHGKAGMDMDNDQWNYIKWLFDKSRHVKIRAQKHKTDEWIETVAVKGDDGVYYTFEGRNKSYHTVKEI